MDETFNQKKKGVEMSMSVIIIAALCLIILVVLVVLIIRSSGNVNDALKCTGKGGVCKDTGTNCETPQGADLMCDANTWCCKPLSSTS